MKAAWGPDRDPLASLAEGRREPFEAFVRAETATFVGFFRRLGAAPEEAEDLTQDVFLKLYQMADRYRPEARFTALCFRVARNAWIDAERRRSVRPRAAAGAVGEVSDRGAEPVRGPLASEGDGADPAATAGEVEEAARLLCALETLPEGQRAALELGLVQGVAYPEVARILGIPVGTVKSRVFHALRRLREHLEPGAAGGGEEARR